MEQLSSWRAKRLRNAAGAADGDGSSLPIKLVRSEISVLDSHLARLRAVFDSRHPELDGRRHTPTGQVAKLYPNLGQKEREQKPSNRE